MGRPQESIIETGELDAADVFTGGPLGTGSKQVLSSNVKVSLNEKRNTLYSTAMHCRGLYHLCRSVL